MLSIDTGASGGMGPEWAGNQLPAQPLESLPAAFPAVPTVPQGVLFLSKVVGKVKCKCYER